MKNINKNLPIVVLQALKQFLTSLDNSHSKLFQIVDHESFLLRMIDNDPKSGFFFDIEKYDPTNGLTINYKPRNQKVTNSYRVLVSINEVGVYFKIWNDCLIDYEELAQFYKDPFLKNLEDQFLKEFDLREEAKNEPLELKQIYYLDEHLSKIEQKIGNYRTEDNSREIEGIIQETAYIKSQLAKQTKEWIAKKVSALCAKITKEGPGILKSIFKEIGKEIMSQGVKALFEHGYKLLP